MIVIVDGKTTVDSLISVNLIFVVKFNWSVQSRWLWASATLPFISVHAKPDFHSFQYMLSAGDQALDW